VCDQAKNVKAAFANVAEAESSEEVIYKLLVRQNKLDLKAARDKLLKEKAMIIEVAEVIRLNKEIEEFNKSNSQLNDEPMVKGKTRAELLANFDDDLANDNTDDITLTDSDENLNEDTMNDEDEEIESPNDSLNSSSNSDSDMNPSMILV
jgi:activator of HSP90 ATPase